MALITSVVKYIVASKPALWVEMIKLTTLESNTAVGAAVLGITLAAVFVFASVAPQAYRLRLWFISP